MPTASLLLANLAVWMMFVNLPMLLVGNLLIGLLEGLILTFTFKVRWRRAVAFMIAANYVSMLAGLAFFGFVGIEGIYHLVWRPTIGDYREWFWSALLLAFVLSILLEWPLCRLSFSPPTRSWKRSLLACFVLQAVSYPLCLIPILHWYEEIHINDNVEIVSVASIVDGEEPFWIYYIDADDHDIYRMRLDGTDIEPVWDIQLDPDHRLFLWSDDEPIEPYSQFDLYSVREDSRWISLIEENFASSESAFQNPDFDKNKIWPAWHSYAYAADLRSENEKHFFARVDREGLNVVEDWQSPEGDYHGLGHWIFAYGGFIRLQFKTTIGSWRCVNPTILPGNIVILEFGGQICVLDIEQRKLALICMGSGPIVVRDEVETSSASEDPEDTADQVEADVAAEAGPGEDGDRP